MDASTINANTITLRDSLNNSVAATVSYNPFTFTAVLIPPVPCSVLANLHRHRKRLSEGVTDVAGNPLASDFIWSFTTADSELYIFGQTRRCPLADSSLTMRWSWG